MVKKIKAGVSLRALLARINRKLAQQGEKVVKSRPRDFTTLGEWFVVNVNPGHYVVRPDVDLEQLGQELGVLRPWEALDKQGE
jgi:hypothetical protein